MHRKNIYSANMSKALQKAKGRNIPQLKKGGCVSMKLPKKVAGGGCGCK